MLDRPIFQTFTCSASFQKKEKKFLCCLWENLNEETVLISVSKMNLIKAILFEYKK